MNIRDMLAAHDAEYISLGQLLKDVAKAGGVTVHEAARALLLKGALSRVDVFVPLLSGGARSRLTAFFMMGRTCLDHMAAASGDDPIPEKTAEDLVRFELQRREVAQALEDHGFKVPASLGGETTNAGLRDAPAANAGACKEPADARQQCAGHPPEMPLVRGELVKQPDAPGAFEGPDWTTHKSSLSKVAEEVAETNGALPAWPKQEPLIAELQEKYGLSRADAKAVDAVTRPDDLRKKKLSPQG